MFQCTNCEGSGYFDTLDDGEVACSVCHGTPEIDADTLDSAIAERDALRTALTAALDWLENAPISYANGNVHNGMDEGDVLGNRHHEKLITQLRVALNVGCEVICEFPVGEFANNDYQ